jgi:glycosyltransferase involved in cell wall biosynthesis
VRERLRSVCLISAGIGGKSLRLQPWRYLFEVARQLRWQGHRVNVISNGGGQSLTTAEIDGITVYRIPSVQRLRGRSNPLLDETLKRSMPDVILWHLGLPSFLHQHFAGWPDVPVVGIFPGLIYRWHELTRLGMGRLARGLNLSAMHMVGAIIPRSFLKKPIERELLKCLVVQTDTTARRLVSDGLPANRVQVIPPGVDEIWHNGHNSKYRELREKLSYGPSDVVVLYFGSPAPLRGLHTLIRALEIAGREDPAFKLMVLSRRQEAELVRDDADLKRLLSQSCVRSHIQVVSGHLPVETLVEYVAASDVVALPFELVPADAPLSVLEALALGKPVVTTTVGCLPELVENGISYLAAPADHLSLASALLQSGRAICEARRSNGGVDIKIHTSGLAQRSWQDVGEEWSKLIESL